MAVYVRGAGAHVAERVRPAPGSEQETRLERMVASGEGGWRRLDESPSEGGAQREAGPAKAGRARPRKKVSGTSGTAPEADA